MLIKFTYVDVMTRRPVNEEPAVNGHDFPTVPGITFDFGNESEWPCSFPLFFGWCDDDADPLTPGIIEVIPDNASYDAVKAVEMSARIDRRKAETRQQRDRLLYQSDWTQLHDTPLNGAKKLDWRIYRQQLRNIPQQAGFPNDIEWPEAPDAPHLLTTASNEALETV